MAKQKADPVDEEFETPAPAPEPEPTPEPTPEPVVIPQWPASGGG